MLPNGISQKARVDCIARKRNLSRDDLKPLPSRREMAGGFNSADHGSQQESSGRAIPARREYRFFQLGSSITVRQNVADVNLVHLAES